MINIAICISGEPRRYERCLQTVQTYREITKNSNININVFYHFWNNETKNVWKQRFRRVTTTPEITAYEPGFFEKIFQPTVGVCEEKDTLNKEIKFAFDYLQEILKKNNIIHYPDFPEWEDTWSNLNKFAFKVKNTNIPVLSQVISYLRAQNLRIKYEKQHNIKHDIIIKTRSDIIINPLSVEQLNSLSQQRLTKKYIQFRHLIIKQSGSTQHEQDAIGEFDDSTSKIWAEPGFFIFSSSSVKDDVFESEQFLQDTVELMFISNTEKQRLKVHTDHTIIPSIFYKRNCRLRAPITEWKYKLYHPKIKTEDY